MISFAIKETFRYCDTYSADEAFIEELLVVLHQSLTLMENKLEYEHSGQHRKS